MSYCQRMENEGNCDCMSCSYTCQTEEEEMTVSESELQEQELMNGKRLA